MICHHSPKCGPGEICDVEIGRTQPPLTLPTDSATRKTHPVYMGCVAYFPAAIAGVAHHSQVAGAKHTAGKLIHVRKLSTDHADCVMRHLMDLHDLLAHHRRSGSVPAADILSEADALAWRALALSQTLHEEFGDAPVAPAADLK